MVSIKDLFSGYATSLHEEPPHLTLNKKLIINVAPTGSFTSRQQNPYQPYTMEENIRAAVESYRAGAAVWHVHARDDDGMPSKDPAVMRETIDRVRAECPDIVTSVIPYVDYNAPGVSQVSRCVDYMVKAGPHYMETAVLICTTGSFSEKFTYTVTSSILTDIVNYLEERGVKPEFQGHSYQALKDTYDWILARDLASAPALLNVMLGFHGYSHASPVGPDPWNYIYLMAMQGTLPSGAVHGICAGGRNWLPFANMAILLGFDMVRVGMEDSVYLHPHRDDKIRRCAETVERVVAIAKALGREIATPEVARQIMGLKPMHAQVPA